MQGISTGLEQAKAQPAGEIRPADARSAAHPYWVKARAELSTQRISPFVHNLHTHPLLQLDALAQLAQELMPLKGCRFISPGTEEASAFTHAARPHDGRTLAALFADISRPGSWVALYNIESAPRYRALMEGVIDSVRDLIEREQGKVLDVQGFIFISAPPAVTPFHIDRENNFWMQLRGRKQMTLWDHRDRQTVADAAREAFIVTRDLSRVRLADEARARGQSFNVQPGEGVFFPSTTPHTARTEPDWVTPEDGVSVSLGLNFYTERTRHHARVHQFNYLLRRAGLKPTPPGTSAWRDRIKAPLGMIGARLRQRLTGRAIPPWAA